MKEILSDAFDFHHEVNEKLMDYFEEHEGKISQKSLDWFSHTLIAQHHWNCMILSQKRTYEFVTHPLELCRKINDLNLESSRKILAESDLNAKIKWGRPGQQAYQSKVWEILFQVSNHYFHHRGQIMADLRANGLEPLWLDYIALRREMV